MLAAITDRTRIVLVCTPNNPTGTGVHQAELEAFLDQVPSDVLVVVDEAYLEFVRDPRLPDALAIHAPRPNVVVLRTFSKAYGLAGLRVGYAVAHEPVAAALRKTAMPVRRQLASPRSAAIASLDAFDELECASRRWSPSAPGSSRRCADQGWTLPDAQANFVWFRLGEPTLDFPRRRARRVWPCGRTAARACASRSASARPTTGWSRSPGRSAPAPRDQLLKPGVGQID